MTEDFNRLRLTAISTYFNAWIIDSNVTKTQFKRGKYLYKIERTEVPFGTEKRD